MLIGFLFAVICGITMPLAMLIFGDTSGKIVDYVSKASDGNLTDIKRQELDDKLMEDMRMFAINMCSVGVACIAFSYISNTLFSYTASRQVSKRIHHIILAFLSHLHGQC